MEDCDQCTMLKAYIAFKHAADIDPQNSDRCALAEFISKLPVMTRAQGQRVGNRTSMCTAAHDVNIQACC
jgi:hypothetical protein